MVIKSVVEISPVHKVYVNITSGKQYNIEQCCRNINDSYINKRIKCELKASVEVYVLS